MTICMNFGKGSISLDLCKSYNVLDRYRWFIKLAGYGMGTRTLSILRTYWVLLYMASKTGVHYGPVLKSHYGVNQGDPLSPTIFNVIVDAFI